MKPDMSRWRNNSSYDFFDTLPIEGLAWECLRRSDPYHRFYRDIAIAGAEREPLTTGAQKRWGLRFPGAARFVVFGARRFVVASGRSCRTGSHVLTGFPITRS
ncbi:transcriptional regulator domain-containing protein [Mesorhizobium sp. ORM8.1]